MDWAIISRTITHLDTLDLEEFDTEVQRLQESDPVLFQQVDQLLGSRKMAGGFMQTRMPGSEAAPVASLDTGDRIAVWEIEELLGAGGMGEVYKARRADGLFEQQVALKLAKSTSEGFRARFEAERQRLAQLEHPNIARIVDGGTSESGAPYMTMEFVDGQPINTYATEHRLSRAQRLALVSKLCSALSHAHGRLVLHRDIKHDNLLINDAGEVRLIDFGVASLLDDPETQSGRGPLTIGYAAPEQLLGQPVTAATDIFAVGMLVHLLETGTLPERQSDGGVAIDTGRLGDADLAAILAKATAKDPQDRYGSVDALGDDLARFLEGFPVAARPVSSVTRLKKLVARNKLASGMSAAAAVALVAGVIGVSVFAVRANEARAEAESRLAFAEYQAEEALINDHGGVAIRDTFAGLMSNGDLDRQTLNQFFLQLEQRYQDEISADPFLSGGKIFGIAREFMRSKDHATSSEIAQRALERDEIEGALRVKLLNLQGRNFKELGDDRRAIAALTEAIEWFRDRPELIDSIEYAESLKDRLLYGPDKSDADEVRKRFAALIAAEEDQTRRRYFINELSLVEQQLGNHGEYARLQEESLKEILASKVAPLKAVSTRLAALYPLGYGSQDVAKLRQYLPTVEEVRASMGSNIMLYSQYRWKEAIILMREGQNEQAFQAIMDGVKSVEENFPIGSGYHTVYCAQVVEMAALAGQFDTAHRYLDYIAVPAGADLKSSSVMRSKLAQALYALETGDEETARKRYREAESALPTIRSSVELSFKFERLTERLRP